MGKRVNPRHGSMQFWHRRRAKRPYARIRYWPDVKNNTLLGFAGFKAGMTRVTAVDNRKTSMTKGQTISIPVTIVECPPLKIAAVRLYENGYNGKQVSKDVFVKVDKNLAKRTGVAKPGDLTKINADDYSNATILVYTNPQLTDTGNKKPTILEMAYGGSTAELLEFVKNNTEVKISDVFKDGQFVDVHAVTKGKGFQGPVKRFGVSIRSHKSEKTIRGPGSLGGWKGHAHFMWRIAFAGQMGFHTRTEYNKQIIQVGSDGFSVKGGIVRYGNIKNDYILIKGSVAGAKKRLIRFNYPIRKTHLHNETPYTISNVVEDSHQGA